MTCCRVSSELLRDFERERSNPQPTHREATLQERAIRTQLGELANKAEACNKLVKSIASERQKLQSISSRSALPSTNLQPSDHPTTLLAEMQRMRETQEQLSQVVTRLQMELAEERKMKDSLLTEIRSLRTVLDKQRAQCESAGGIDPAKCKELKKRLLMANLRILELTSKAPHTNLNNNIISSRPE